MSGVDTPRSSLPPGTWPQCLSLQVLSPQGGGSMLSFPSVRSWAPRRKTQPPDAHQRALLQGVAPVGGPTPPIVGGVLQLIESGFSGVFELLFVSPLLWDQFALRDSTRCYCPQQQSSQNPRDTQILLPRKDGNSWRAHRYCPQLFFSSTKLERNNVGLFLGNKVTLK